MKTPYDNNINWLKGYKPPKKILKHNNHTSWLTLVIITLISFLLFNYLVVKVHAENTVAICNEKCEEHNKVMEELKYKPVKYSQEYWAEYCEYYKCNNN